MDVDVQDAAGFEHDGQGGPMSPTELLPRNRAVVRGRWATPAQPGTGFGEDGLFIGPAGRHIVRVAELVPVHDLTSALAVPRSSWSRGRRDVEGSHSAGSKLSSTVSGSPG